MIPAAAVEITTAVAAAGTVAFIISNLHLAAIRQPPTRVDIGIAVALVATIWGYALATALAHDYVRALIAVVLITALGEVVGLARRRARTRDERAREARAEDAPLARGPQRASERARERPGPIAARAPRRYRRRKRRGPYH